MSKTATRPSLADRLAAVAGPQIPPSQPIASKPQREPEKTVTPKVLKAVAAIPAAEPSTTTKARIGKTMIAGYFTPQMARAVKLLAVERDTTVQALIGEGLDAVLHKYGKHPMGER